ncbi:MAG TPA: hypothetical protein VI248_18805 [Kineosporiaceae bacterium]
MHLAGIGVIVRLVLADALVDIGGRGWQRAGRPGVRGGAAGRR